MAEAITYADLRFVKAPLKKTLSSRLGPGELDEDGELTYENVQPSAPPLGSLPNLASSGPKDSAGVSAQQPIAAWSDATSPAARWLLRCRATRTQYFLLSLLLSCLLLGVASICLGVRYMQVSQQLQQKNRVLEATNSSLRQQLNLSMKQLRLSGEDLQGCRRELVQSQDSLQEKHRAYQAATEELQQCQSDRDDAKKAQQHEQQQKMDLEQRLRNTQSTLRPYFTCSSPGKKIIKYSATRVNIPSSLDICCPVGWILVERSCYYISPDKKTWEMSRSQCKSLSSDLAAFQRINEYSVYVELPRELLLLYDKGDSYWIDLRYNAESRWTEGPTYMWYISNEICTKLSKHTEWKWNKLNCQDSLPYICKMAAFRFPDREHSLH